MPEPIQLIPAEFMSQSGGFIRAVPQGDPLTNFQLGIDGPVSELMIGNPKLIRMLGNSIYRTVGVPTVSFQYQKFGLERFETKDAKRGMRAKFQTSELAVDTVSAKLARFGWAALLDRDEIANSEAFEGVFAMSLRIRERHQSLSREIVELTLEKLRATQVLAAGSYSQSTPDLDSTPATKWNDTGGDSRKDIRAAASTLAAANGIQIENIDVYLSHAAYEAAQDDPTMLSRRVNTGMSTVGTEILREYWGVNSVTVGDAYEIDSAGTGVVSMYGDIAVLKVAQPLVGYDDTEGQLDSFVKFKWRQFVAGSPLQPWFINEITSWTFPFEDWEFSDTVNITAAAIIRDVAL
jgi:hypothetical protein